MYNRQKRNEEEHLYKTLQLKEMLYISEDAKSEQIRRIMEAQ